MASEYPNTRSDPQAYARYLAGMDASMRQKVALTAAHLLARGRVADMGTGSGSGAFALAALYPELAVIGVDQDPEIIALARTRHARENLTFVAGDIATPVFEDGTLTAILDSSVLHHVTTFTGYDHDAAARALAVQARALALYGTLIVRDFVAPDDTRDVHLDLPANDGDDSDEPKRAHSAARLRRFAREFRSLAATPGFPHSRVQPDPRPGWQRHRLSRKHAVEYLLRKDYREDWLSEVREEYTYFTQRQFEAVFANLGLRVLASTPLYNPWIVRHRFEGRCALSDAATHAPLPMPPTNFVIVGEKVPPHEGVRFRDAGEVPPIDYLRLECHRDRETGLVRDLVRRPNPTLDVIPWFVQHDDLFVLARTSYPRPLLASSAAQQRSPCGARASHYLTEPLSVVMSDTPLGDTVEAALVRAGLAPDQILAICATAPHYPSPGGTLEEVRPVAVHIQPTLCAEPLAPSSGFSTSGHLRAIEAQQLLRAAAVGGLPDTRLEIATYALLNRLARSPGPWLGDRLTLSDNSVPPAHNMSVTELLARPPRRRFTRAAEQQSPGFLERRTARFEELSADNRLLGTKTLELVLPCKLSLFTVVAAVLWRCGADLYLGVDDDDLPAAQCFRGESQLLVAPAWRLPQGDQSRESMQAFARAQLLSDYGVSSGDVIDLGGRYHPSPGLSPEVAYPLAFEALGLGPARLSLRFTPLLELARSPEALLDGHLRTVTLRAAHALGCLAHE